jgi:crotonobetainyl-CoA:carnitine CoA-transferase CaiB-like acyl-CoA transferase
MAGEAFVAASISASPEPRGNRSSRWAPQGCYPARGDDQWIVVSCRTDEEWSACADVLGRADIAGLSLDERYGRHDDLDQVIAAWSVLMDPDLVVEVLQEAGVPAARVLDMRTIKSDGHLDDRRFWVRLPDEKMRPYRRHGIVWRLAEANPQLRRHAPYFGEHNDEILGGLLGLSSTELRHLAAARVIADAPIDPKVG